VNSAAVAWVLGGILGAGTLWLAIASNLLRDSSRAAYRPFSFSRVQLVWWVVIVAFCLLYHYGTAFSLPAINETCLVLLGISGGTTTLAHLIDVRQRRLAQVEQITLNQDQDSQGFFTDILSDDSGLSVHRLQALLFNVIYGVAFVTDFIRNGGEFDVYGALQYAVLGLSSAGYLGLKAFENSPDTRAASPRAEARAGGGDELLDPDPESSGSTAAG